MPTPSPSPVDLDPRDLLLSRRLHDVSHDPVFLLVVDDFLPSPIYEALSASFPGDEWFVCTEEGDKRHFMSTHTPELVAEFVDQQLLWGRLFDTFRSRLFLDDLHQVVRGALRHSRGRVGALPWRVATSSGRTPLGRWLSQPVTLEVQFSRLEAGSTILPHTDRPEKLVSIMLYFADERWSDSYGGGTGFYRPRNPALERNWHNRSVAFHEVDAYRVVPFRSNRLVLFVKSENSYHGVPPLTSPPGLYRDSLNVNVYQHVPTSLERARDRLGRGVGKLQRAGSRVMSR